MTRLIAPLVLLLAVAGCAAPPDSRLPQLSFDHLPDLRLDVGEVQVVSRAETPMQAPHVEHLFPTPPEAALRRWAEDRLVATGDDNVAVFIIDEASATETRLEHDKGLRGALTKEQADRYTVEVKARLEIYEQRAGASGFAEARATRSLTVREDASLNDRERSWFDLTEKTLHDFDAEMEQAVRRHLDRWLH